MLMISLLLACTTSDITTTELVDVGIFCIDSMGDYSVDFEQCLSSSCDTLTSVSCTGEMIEGELVLATEAIIQSEGTVCTTDCGFVRTTCELPDTFDTDGLTVRIGDTTTTFQNTPSCN